MIQARCTTIPSKIYQELGGKKNPQKRKGSIIVPAYKKCLIEIWAR
jgi:hypothetical protein